MRRSRAVRAAAFPYAAFRNVLLEGVYFDKHQDQHLVAVHESKIHDYLYECLSILDRKATALLQYDSIVLAAATLALTVIPNHTSVGSLIIVVALILSGLSSLACLQVVWVYWTETADFTDATEKFKRLLKIRNLRTVMYRLSWISAQVSVAFLISGIILREV